MDRGWDRCNDETYRATWKEATHRRMKRSPPAGIIGEHGVLDLDLSVGNRKRFAKVFLEFSYDESICRVGVNH